MKKMNIKSYFPILFLFSTTANGNVWDSCASDMQTVFRHLREMSVLSENLESEAEKLDRLKEHLEVCSIGGEGLESCGFELNEYRDKKNKFARDFSQFKHLLDRFTEEGVIKNSSCQQAAGLNSKNQTGNSFCQTVLKSVHIEGERNTLDRCRLNNIETQCLECFQNRDMR